MTDRFEGLSPDDRDLAHVVEYQAGKSLDETVITEVGWLVETLNDDLASRDKTLLGRLDDDIIILPDGGHLRLYWGVEVVSPEEINTLTKQ